MSESAGNQSSCKVVKFDPWDMLNNFCFHVYAQKSLGFFTRSTPVPLTLELMLSNNIIFCSFITYFIFCHHERPGDKP